MTDKVQKIREEVEKLKKLADAMYYAAFNLTTDASLLRKAMKEYRQFIIHEYYKEETVSEDLNKSEEFIQNYTRNCSNEILSPYPQINNDIRRIDGEPAKEYSPWLTPDQARRAVEIAREETIKDVCEWIKNHLNDDYISTDEESVRVGCPYSYLETNLFIEDLKKHFKGKL